MVVGMKRNDYERYYSSIMNKTQLIRKSGLILRLANWEIGDAIDGKWKNTVYNKDLIY